MSNISSYSKATGEIALMNTVMAQAQELGCKLERDQGTLVYWLIFEIFSQPCPTLGDVAAALKPGSGWRKLMERVTAKVTP